jgi:hypothetical protein
LGNNESLEKTLTCEKFRFSTAMTISSNILKENVILPNSEGSGKLAFILLNVFTPEECQQWIKMTEERGYAPALVNVGPREVLMSDFRNNDRCIIDNADMAQILFERIKSYLPKIWKNYEVVGLNERLRFLRYERGQKFEKHMGKNIFSFFFFGFIYLILTLHSFRQYNFI